MCLGTHENSQVKYGNLESELKSLVALSRSKRLPFDWKSLAGKLKISPVVIQKHVNKALSHDTTNAMDMLMENEKYLNDAQQQRAYELVEKCEAIPRSPIVIAAGILAYVTKDDSWFERLEVSKSSKVNIIKDLKLLSNDD